jgi:hypothetical protein
LSPKTKGKSPTPTPTEEDVNAAYIKVVSDVQQGDLISLGAVTLVGKGATQAWKSTAEFKEGQPPSGEDLWSLTIESESGWYVIISQDCDIERTPDIEPALVVCPIKYVTEDEWKMLRSGPTSPREFPFPDGKRLPIKEGYAPVADLRFVTSVDKTALSDGSVKFLRPLSSPQRKRFSDWVGARYSREAHSNELEENVLPRVARLLGKMVTSDASTRTDPAYRLLDAAEGWYIGGNNKGVIFYVFTSEAAAIKAGLWDKIESDFDRATAKSAAKRLANMMRGCLKPDSGYAINVEVTTTSGIKLAEFLELSEWVIESPVDPLSEA